VPERGVRRDGREAGHGGPSGGVRAGGGGVSVPGVRRADGARGVGGASGGVGRGACDGGVVQGRGEEKVAELQTKVLQQRSAIAGLQKHRGLADKVAEL